MMSTLEELQSEIEKLKSEAAAHRKGKAEEREKAETLQKRLDEISATGKKAEEEKMLAENRHEELFKRREAELTGSLEKSKANGTAWQKRFEQLAIDGQIISAAAKYNAHEPSIIAKLVRDSIALDEQGGVFVRAGEGVAMTDKGERLTVESYVQNYMHSNPYLVKSTGSGSGSTGGKGTDNKQSISRSEFDQKPPADQSSFIRGGGVLTE